VKVHLSVVLMISCLFVAVTSSFASAPNVYIAQNATGGANGTSCANAYGLAFFNTSGNWGSEATQIGAGTTVHLCGTITGTLNSNILTFHGSGTSGNSITLKWETGAELTSPACSTCINVAGNSWITLDGNGTNPSITNTANGSSLANQIDSVAIQAQPCNNCEFKNLDITNIYVHVAGIDTTTGYGTGIKLYGSNFLIHNNTFDGMFAEVEDGYNSGDTNLQIYQNTFDHMNWGVHIGNNNTNVLSHVYLHDNHLMDMDNWDTPSDAYHHDGLFVVQNDISASITDVEMYNNIANGVQGSNATAWIYVNTAMNGVYIYNNILTNMGNGGYAIEGGFSGDRNYYIINNSIDCKGSSAISIGPVTNFTIENNAIYDCQTYLYTHNITGAVTVNNNAYDLAGSTGGSAFKWNGNNGGATFLQYQAATGLDSSLLTLSSFGWNSLYILQPGSALIGKGTNLTDLDITALDTDKAGTARPSTGAWDIGAYESGAVAGQPAPPSGLIATVE